MSASTVDRAAATEIAEEHVGVGPWCWRIEQRPDWAFRQVGVYMGPTFIWGARACSPGTCPRPARPHRDQIRSISTSAAWAASASRSSGSDVSTVPPGSANATTSASTADPRRARRRSRAARRARDSGTASAMLQVFRNRFSFASRPACPCKHSTRTNAGTVGGHKPSSRRATIRARARRERSASWLTAPESRINTTASQSSDASVGRFVAPRRPRERALEEWAGRPVLQVRPCSSGWRTVASGDVLRSVPLPEEARMRGAGAPLPFRRDPLASRPAYAAYA